VDFNQIVTNEDLEFLNQELLLKPYVGIDTEFRRTSKDNMRLALLQINDGEEIYLIDTTTINNLKDECSFLHSDSVVKIFHSCKEDIEAIYSWTGNLLVNIFDTQIAEALLGGEYSVSYQGLVEKKLGIKVDKGETRSNWLRRPLTDSQLKYAASDVEFLIDLYLDQNHMLGKADKSDWMDEEILDILSKIFEIKDEEIKSSSLSNKEEINLLNKFNDVIHCVADREKINPTFLFSKKNQKDFIRSVSEYGIETSLKSLTRWRSNLLQNELFAILS
tara:strand:+ start:905 stop:1732 length:828 start_codon:yes stop_codon:yes gene_type:complete